MALLRSLGSPASLVSASPAGLLSAPVVEFGRQGREGGGL